MIAKGDPELKRIGLPPKAPSAGQFHKYVGRFVAGLDHSGIRERNIHLAEEFGGRLEFVFRWGVPVQCTVGRAVDFKVCSGKRKGVERLLSDAME